MKIIRFSCNGLFFAYHTQVLSEKPDEVLKVEEAF